MLSLVHGTAFESDVSDLSEDALSRIRVYRNSGTYIGQDTTDIEHVCNESCMFQRIDDERFAPADVDSRVFVGIDAYPLAGVPYVDTIDVVDFDPGDDPYILCAACGAELLRDEEKYLEQYGRPIGDPSPS